MATSDPRAQGRPSEPAPYFAETALGAVVLLSIQFLSVPILVGGLALFGVAKLVSRFLTVKAT